jgi:hypothetical protein
MRLWSNLCANLTSWALATNRSIRVSVTRPLLSTTIVLYFAQRS